MKNTLNEVKRLQKIAGLLKEEGMDTQNKMDFSEAIFKMDKWLPDEESLQMEYYGILGDKRMSSDQKVEAITSFIENNAYFDVLERYVPKNSTIKDLAIYIVQQSEKVKK